MSDDERDDRDVFERVCVAVCALLPEERCSGLCEVVARAALAAAYPEGSVWQPIETAPRDGTRILWCADNGEFTKRRWSYNVIWWPEYEACFSTGYWRPLPAAPTPGAGAGEGEESRRPGHSKLVYDKERRTIVAVDPPSAPEAEKCPTCKGMGDIYHPSWSDSQICATCKGSGLAGPSRPATERATIERCAKVAEESVTVECCGKPRTRCLAIDEKTGDCLQWDQECCGEPTVTPMYPNEVAERIRALAATKEG